MITLKLTVGSDNIKDLIQTLQYVIDNDLDEWKKYEKLPTSLIAGDVIQSKTSKKELLFDWSFDIKGE